MSLGNNHIPLDEGSFVNGESKEPSSDKEKNIISILKTMFRSRSKTSGLVYLDTIFFVYPKRSICPPIAQFQCLKDSPSLCSLKMTC